VSIEVSLKTVRPHNCHRLIDERRASRVDRCELIEISIRLSGRHTSTGQNVQESCRFNDGTLSLQRWDIVQQPRISRTINHESFARRHQRIGDAASARPKFRPTVLNAWFAWPRRDFWEP
jgi:hypothetical protein